jgi:hypothetical protein
MRVLSEGMNTYLKVIFVLVSSTSEVIHHAPTPKVVNYSSGQAVYIERLLIYTVSVHCLSYTQIHN